MIRLGVNIDHVATVRQARRGAEPDPVAAAILATLGGADGITIHLREDRRHIQDRDLHVLRQTVTTRLNLEMACSDEIIAIALKAKPDEVTLVPEKRQELTTEGGLDVQSNIDCVRKGVDQLKAGGILVSLFIDTDIEQVDLAKAVGADAIEFHTGTYADAVGRKAVGEELAKLQTAAAHAVRAGLHVHMGHGLNYQNVPAIVRIPGVEELNIGFSIISRALMVGMTQAVRDMKHAMSEHYPNPKKTV
ncbi:pyridoxine 5'-phosphate synthase [Limnoglobus roseus]|uniref:Pyridoxine 5'-phosphate synthase n=1 Tax=Limnoglobus roseus TaxID=2598579 RepID=A0A5C1A4N8_9BACT|nr:pyridoxine 5'-phosphate synthase [Limnoglobus roseus]QEL13367.1 pyridoxine 5'-phosphate synthase [Limnoglobus roseus]